MSALKVVWIKIRDRPGDCISRKYHKHEDLSSNPQHQQKKKNQVWLWVPINPEMLVWIQEAC